MHALVLLLAATDAALAEADDHVAFIDELIARKKIVLGGDWKPPVAGVEAAYLLSCASLDEAHAIATTDPFVRSGAMRFQVVEWQLVDFDADAIDRGSLLDPR